MLIYQSAKTAIASNSSNYNNAIVLQKINLLKRDTLFVVKLHKICLREHFLL